MVIDLDLETSGLDWKTDKIHLIGYTTNEKDIKYADPLQRSSDLSDLVGNPDNFLRGSNIVFDALFLSRSGYQINCGLIDTRVMAYICWPELEEHGLKFLVQNKLGSKYERTLDTILFRPLKSDAEYLKGYEEHYYVIDSKWGRKDHIEHYHKEDILNVPKLVRLMRPNNWFWDVEVPLTRILFEMQLTGCPLDIQKLKDIHKPVLERLESLKDDLGRDFNPSSTQQVAEKFKQLGVDLGLLAEKGESGNYKLDKIFLKRQAWRGCQFSKNMLEYRALSKLNSTYIEPFLGSEFTDQRLHGSFNQAGRETAAGDTRGTVTGRLASSNPNLQNIPSRTKLGKQIRECFISSKGKLLADADLKQIEPRLIGHYSQSPKLIYAYANGLDTHGIFAESIFGKQYTPTERFIGKTGWLATTYGCSSQKLLQICETYQDDPLDIDFSRFEAKFYTLPKDGKAFYTQNKLRMKYGEEAPRMFAKWEFFKDFQDKFIKSNPEIWGWRNAVINRTRQTGYITTIGGRTIRIQGLDSSDKRLRSQAERQCINYLIQGSASDIMKLILVQLHKHPKFTGNILATVHDEVLAEIDNEGQLDVIKDCMENTVKLRNIRIETDAKIIPNWGSK